jgi:uncharacterized protein YpuA (DUF1002 family)
MLKVFVGTLLAFFISGPLVLAEQPTNPTGNTQQDTSRVITLGADLDPDQRVAMLRVFGFTAEEAGQLGVPILSVTNAEEQAMLGGTVPDTAIGTRAISSAFVEQRQPGQGINVERYNITYITDAMYGNALVTGGVRDARVVVAAPISVSGTAALTGIFKAFERVAGRALSEQAKSTAGQELVATGQLGEQLGNKDKASELVARVKEQVANKGIEDPNRIRQIVVKVAADLNVKLTKEQTDQVTDVAVKVSRLDVNASDIRNQVRDLGQSITNLNPSTETRNVLQKLLDFLTRLFSQFFGAVFGLASRLWS